MSRLTWMNKYFTRSASINDKLAKPCRPTVSAFMIAKQIRSFNIVSMVSRKSPWVLYTYLSCHRGTVNTTVQYLKLVALCFYRYILLLNDLAKILITASKGIRRGSVNMQKKPCPILKLGSVLKYLELALLFSCHYPFKLDWYLKILIDFIPLGLKKIQKFFKKSFFHRTFRSI